MRRRETLDQKELNLPIHISELRHGYEIVAYYSKATNRYHAAIVPNPHFKERYPVYTWYRNPRGYKDGLALSAYQQILQKRFRAADAAHLGLVKVQGEELRTARCEFDEICFRDGLLGDANGISMALNGYRSEHAERQPKDVERFDSFCRECARRVKGRIGELPEDLPKTDGCPWKSGRSARCDASCLRMCETLWALRHLERIGDTHEPLRPSELGSFHWRFDDRGDLPVRTVRVRGGKLRLFHSAGVRDESQFLIVRERSTGIYHVDYSAPCGNERIPTMMLSPDLTRCLGVSDVNVVLALSDTERFESLGYVGFDADADSVASAFEHLCFADGKRYFPDEVAAHLQQILRFRDYCRECRRVAGGACRMCARRSNAVRLQDSKNVCREECLLLWALRHHREIGGWRTFRPVLAWDDGARRAYEAELKKRNLPAE